MRAMRQRDWARIFGLGCAVGAVGLSLLGRPGGQWDAFILLLGALMLLRGAVEVPVATRGEGVVRALALTLLIFAFAAVNRAQGGGGGAVAGVFASWILWAVAALLLLLPILRRGLAWGLGRGAVLAILAMTTVLAGMALWPGEDAARLRVLVVVAVAAQVALILPRGRGLDWGVALGVAGCCLTVMPGAVVWPVAAVLLPLGAGLGLWRGARG